MAETVAVIARALVTQAKALDFIFPDGHTDIDDTLKDQLNRAINFVSEEFEKEIGRPIIKKNIKEYWNGGSDVFHVKHFPVWAYEDDDNAGYVLLGDDLIAYDGETDQLFQITDTDDDSLIDSDYFTVDQDTGVVNLDYMPVFERRRYKVEYTAGYFLNTAGVNNTWEQMALMAVKAYYDKETASYTRSTGEGLIFPRQWPAQVQEFLAGNRKYNV